MKAVCGCEVSVSVDAWSREGWADYEVVEVEIEFPCEEHSGVDMSGKYTVQ